MLAFMAVIVTLDVFGRKAGRPVPGAFEFAQLALLLTVCLSLAYTAAQRGHIAIGLFVDRLQPRVQAMLAVLTGCLALAGLCLMIWGGTVQAIHDWQIRMLQTAELRIPVYPFKFVIPLGFSLLGIVLLVQLLQTIGQARKR